MFDLVKEFLCVENPYFIVCKCLHQTVPRTSTLPKNYHIAKELPHCKRTTTLPKNSFLVQVVLNVNSRSGIHLALTLSL